MKKRVFGRKLSRGRGARRALFRSLIRALVIHGAIVTSKAKAKTIQRQIDKIMGLAKEKGVAKRRQVYAILGNDRETSDNLFNKIAPMFSDRVGGYTRIVNLPRRRGDAAEMAKLSWVKEVAISDEEQVKGKGKKKENVRKDSKKELAGKQGLRSKDRKREGVDKKSKARKIIGKLTKMK